MKKLCSIGSKRAEDGLEPSNYPRATFAKWEEACHAERPAKGPSGSNSCYGGEGLQYLDITAAQSLDEVRDHRFEASGHASRRKQYLIRARRW